MEEETVTHHNYEQFLAGYPLTGTGDLNLLEREADEMPEQVKKDSRRFMWAGVLTALAGATLWLTTNIGLGESWPYFALAGLVGLGMGGTRILRRVLGRKTLSLPKLELRRKAERTTANAMSTFGTNRRSGKLSRSDSDKVFMGVCGGLAKHSGISATLIRAIWIAAFAATSGVAAFFYIGLGLILPAHNNEQ